jgi:glyoxylase-like metal-dependent hydrolase (beta-lactamase superfamily II)
LINSHTHWDHWCGNQAFVEDATIIATAKTRELMPESSVKLRQYQDNLSQLETEIREETDGLAKETDPQRKKDREITLSRWRHLHAVLPNLRLSLPDLTFERELTFHGETRSVRLVEYSAGHTPSDAYLVLSDAGVVFTGDLTFFAAQPYMGNCDPEGWLAWHDEADTFHAATFVPGHGPLGTKENLSLQRQYIVAMQQMIDGVIAGEGSVEDALAESLPAPFGAWIAEGRRRFEINVRTLFEWRSKRQSSA